MRILRPRKIDESDSGEAAHFYFHESPTHPLCKVAHCTAVGLHAYRTTSTTHPLPPPSIMWRVSLMRNLSFNQHKTITNTSVSLITERILLRERRSAENYATNSSIRAHQTHSRLTSGVQFGCKHSKTPSVATPAGGSTARFSPAKGRPGVPGVMSRSGMAISPVKVTVAGIKSVRIGTNNSLPPSFHQFMLLETDSAVVFRVRERATAY
jgi:hypothetical protein